MIVMFYLVWKSIDIITSLLAPYFIPYLGFFSYGNTMYQYGLPAFIRALTNFDGIFYIRIALNGYSQYEQAYFPLYPLTIRFLTPLLGKNPIIAGVLISHICFITALYLFNKLLYSYKKNKKERIWIIALFLSYPTSFFFSVMYTESLFLLLLIAGLYFFYRNKYLMTFIFAYLAALTRITGVLLIIPFLVKLLFNSLQSPPKTLKKAISTYTPMILPILGSILGISTYAFYLWKSTGDPLYFFHAQEHFGAQRSTRLILLPQVIYRYIKIFITADKNFQYFVAVMELLFFLFVLGILLYEIRRLIIKSNKKDSLRIGLNLFSLANIIIPSLTGTLTAIPRYSLLSLSFFLTLAEIKNEVVKNVLIILFSIVHIVFFGLFIQGYYLT